MKKRKNLQCMLTFGNGVVTLYRLVLLVVKLVELRFVGFALAEFTVVEPPKVWFLLWVDALVDTVDFLKYGWFVVVEIVLLVYAVVYSQAAFVVDIDRVHGLFVDRLLDILFVGGLDVMYFVALSVGNIIRDSGVWDLSHKFVVFL